MNLLRIFTGRTESYYFKSEFDGIDNIIKKYLNI